MLRAAYDRPAKGRTGAAMAAVGILAAISVRPIEACLALALGATATKTWPLGAAAVLAAGWAIEPLMGRGLGAGSPAVLMHPAETVVVGLALCGIASAVIGVKIGAKGATTGYLTAGWVTMAAGIYVLDTSYGRLASATVELSAARSAVAEDRRILSLPSMADANASELACASLRRLAALERGTAGAAQVSDMPGNGIACDR